MYISHTVTSSRKKKQQTLIVVLNKEGRPGPGLETELCARLRFRVAEADLSFGDD